MEIPRHWRLKKQRYGLVGNECTRCETKYFPPIKVCKKCQDYDDLKSEVTLVYDSGLLFSLNNQVVDSKVLDQE